MGKRPLVKTYKLDSENPQDNQDAQLLRLETNSLAILLGNACNKMKEAQIKYEEFKNRMGEKYRDPALGKFFENSEEIRGIIENFKNQFDLEYYEQGEE